MNSPPKNAYKLVNYAVYSIFILLRMCVALNIRFLIFDCLLNLPLQNILANSSDDFEYGRDLNLLKKVFKN